MGQLLEVIRLLGLPQAVRMKKRFDEALPHVRGYAVCSCLWALLETGALDRLLEAEEVGLDELVEESSLDRHVAESIFSYLDGLSLVRWEAGRVRVMPKLARLTAEPRGFFELTYAYEPVFARLTDMLRGEAKYPDDVQRRGKYVGRGSGQLCRTLPYPILVDMLRRQGARRILDLGCGDLAFLFFACEALPEVTAIGIDNDPPTVDYAREVLAESPYADRIEVREADMFNLETIAAEESGIDAVTAVDTYHEYLRPDSHETVVELFRTLRDQFPGALLYVGEFCKQPHEKLRRQPTAFLEHHLYHDLTNQTITDAASWRTMFAESGLEIVEEKVFDIVGHGYFAVRSAETA
jgi:SAM-dependent methyltransferase